MAFWKGPEQESDEKTWVCSITPPGGPVSAGVAWKVVERKGVMWQGLGQCHPQPMGPRGLCVGSALGSSGLVNMF